MYLYGAGGHAKVVKEMLELNGAKMWRHYRDVRGIMLHPEGLW